MERRIRPTRDVVQPSSYKDNIPFVNGSMPRTIYRRRSLDKGRKRSRWPRARPAKGPGGRLSRPIVLDATGSDVAKQCDKSPSDDDEDRLVSSLKRER